MKKTMIAGAAFLVAVASQAAQITWQDSVQMYPGSTSQSFVDNSGTSVLAISPSDALSGTNTLNGVDFVQVSGSALYTGVTQNGVTVSTASELSTYDGFGDGSFTSDGDIYNVIRSGTYGATTVTLTGLSIGQEYKLQIFSNDSRSGRHSDYEMGLSDGTQSIADSITAGSVGRMSLSNRDPDTGEGEASGDYIIGTFVASATTQSFDVDGSTDGSLIGNSSRAQINGLSLQAIPEPATIGLVAAFGGGVLFIRRRFMM